MVDKFLTKEIVDKIYATIIIDQYGVYPELETTAQIIDEFHTDKVMDKKYIPRLLEQSYYDFVREEIWSMVKYIGKNKIRGIDFKNLKQHSFNKVKEYYPQLFRRTPNEEYSKS